MRNFSEEFFIKNASGGCFWKQFTGLVFFCSIWPINGQCIHHAKASPLICQILQISRLVSMWWLTGFYTVFCFKHFYKIDVVLLSFAKFKKVSHIVQVFPLSTFKKYMPTGTYSKFKIRTLIKVNLIKVSRKESSNVPNRIFKVNCNGFSLLTWLSWKFLHLEKLSKWFC